MRAGSGQVIWKSTAQGVSSHCDFAHQQHKQVAVHFFTSQLMPKEGSLLSWVGSDFCLVQGSLPKLTTHRQLKKYFGLKKTFHHTYAGCGSPYRQCSLPHCQPGQSSLRATHWLSMFQLGENGTGASQIIEISSYVGQRECELSSELLCSRT